MISFSQERGDYMSNIVKYDNDFNLTQHFNRLNQTEQDIFFAITSEFTKRNENSIEIKINELRKKTGMQKNYKPHEMVVFINNISEKLAGMVFTVSKGNEKIIGSLFSVFIINQDTGNLKVKLNTDFLNYFSDIPFSFTQFELQHFLLLRSKYSKILFRILLDLKHYAHGDKNRYWKIDFNEFKKLMTFPISYKSSVVIKTLEKSIDEINETQYIKNLKVKREIGEGAGRPIKNLIFTYKLNKDTSTSEYIEIDSSDILHCPYCGAEVIKKTGKNGEFYGHKYYKQSDCKHSWATLEDFRIEMKLVQEEKEKFERRKKQNKNDFDLLVKEQQKLFKNMGVLKDIEVPNE